MKPYVRKLDCKKGYNYRIFFIDDYGNLYGGIRAFKTRKECLEFGIKQCKESEQ